MTTLVILIIKAQKHDFTLVMFEVVVKKWNLIHSILCEWENVFKDKWVLLLCLS